LGRLKTFSHRKNPTFLRENPSFSLIYPTIYISGQLYDERMTAHKRPATLSPEEALDDLLDDDSENEWLESMQDPVKRCEFERNCI